VVFLFSIAILGAVVGLAAGGRLRGLLLEKLRFVGLLPVWLVLAVIPQVLVMAGFEDWPSGAALVAIRTAHASLVFGVAVLFLVLNLIPWKRPSVDAADRAGLGLLLLGVAGMAAVVLANQGTMPVSVDLLLSTDNPALKYGLMHGSYLDRSLVGPGTVLPWLAWTIPLPLLPADPPYLSLGTLVAAAGLLVLVLTLMRPYGRRSSGERTFSPRLSRSRRPLRGRRRS